MSFPSIGAPAPVFKLQNQRGEWVQLSDFKGKKVVIYFYPKAMTPGCTTQACGIRDSASEYEAANIVVLGISPDPFGRLKKFEDKYGLNFMLLSDEDHAVAECYGVWGLKKFMGREFMGVHRITFIIDEDGALLHVMEKVKTASHHDDVLSCVKAL